jgi:hypothetical protein
MLKKYNKGNKMNDKELLNFTHNLKVSIYNLAKKESLKMSMNAEEFTTCFFNAQMQGIATIISRSIYEKNRDSFMSYFIENIISMVEEVDELKKNL